MIIRNFEYCQIDYTNYPSEDDLNKMGKEGCELVCIETFEKNSLTMTWNIRILKKYIKQHSKEK